MKYNMSNIMKNAWATYRKFQKFVNPLTFSECLKRAWEDAKKAMQQPEQVTLGTVKATAANLVRNGQYETISYKEWNGSNGSNRIYIKAIRHTLTGNIRVADCGYWDCDNAKYVPQAIDLLA